MNAIGRFMAASVKRVVRGRANSTFTIKITHDSVVKDYLTYQVYAMRVTKPSMLVTVAIVD